MRTPFVAGMAALALAAVAAVALLPNEAPVGAVPVEPKTFETCAPGSPLVCDVATGGKYHRAEVATQTCARFAQWPDGGVEALGVETHPLKPRADVEIVGDSCVPALSVPGNRSMDGGVAFLDQACACRKATGVCQYRLEDGSVADAPRGKTLGAGYPPYEAWSGAGCVPKACVEFAGQSS